MGRRLDRKITFVKRLFAGDFYSHRAYVRMYDKLPVREDAVFLESQHGTVLGGNIAAILRTLCEQPPYLCFRQEEHQGSDQRSVGWF